MSIVCIGQAAYDITLPLETPLIENQKYRIFDKLECLGGPAANASYLCALWHASTTFIGRVGSDVYGKSILNDLSKIGVNINYVKILKDFSTPLSIVLNHRYSGDRTILNNPGVVKAQAFTYPDQCDVLLVDGHELDASLKAIERYPHAISILDAGTCRENTLTLAKKVDYFICSEAFARTYYGRDWDIQDPKENQLIFKALHKLNKYHVIITLGDQGLLYEEHLEIKHMPAFPVLALDTTGAGDIFHGAFAYAMSQKMALKEALTLSSMASALAVTKMGGQPSIPSLSEVQEALKRRTSMKLVPMNNMLEKAKQDKRAVGAFNILNLEWTQAILKAAMKCNQDVIISVSENAAKYMGGFKTVTHMVEDLVAYYDCKNEVALHLDHGNRFEVCKEAIDAGFTSVMIDASKLPIDENIAVTKEVVTYAHARGVSVEAEVGIVGGNEDGVSGGVRYADEAECIRICKETNVDFLAPALGSVHGFYKGEPKLGFDEMKSIAKSCDVPLVLHGGSGIDDEKIQKAISCGICKINVNTENQVAFKAKLKEIVVTDALDPRKLLGPAYDAVTDAVVTKIELFNNK